MTHRALTPRLIPLSHISRSQRSVRSAARAQAIETPSPALGKLYHTYRAELVRFARIRIWQAADAEDIVQEAFLAAARAYPDREESELKALLFTMVRNLSINYLKSGYTKHWRASEDIHDGEERMGCDATPTPENIVSDRQQLALVEAALASLPPRRREVLRLHRFEALSYKQIADRLDVSPSTVKTDIAMAVAEIAETLARAERAGGKSR